MQLGSARFPGILAPRGWPRGVRTPKLAKSAISGGHSGLGFVAISSSQALIHGP